MVWALLAQHYGRLNTTTGYATYILDMWHMSCCQCADRGNGTNLYILLCLCPNVSHCTGAPSCPFRRSDPHSLQQEQAILKVEPPLMSLSLPISLPLSSLYAPTLLTHALGIYNSYPYHHYSPPLSQPVYSHY